MKQQPQETDAAFAARCATASRVALSAPESSFGWIVEPDGLTVTPAGAFEEEPAIVHDTREQIAETVSWCLFVAADRARRKASA